MPARVQTLLVFLLLVVAASLIGSSFEAGEWYFVTMRQPSWMPPAWLFGPVWAVIYLLMALAAWTVWLTGHYSRLGPLLWWGLLLVLNICWSALFFGLHRIGWAWLLLCLTVAAAILCIRAFRLLSQQAAWLMTPYLAWVVVIWLLNFWLWTINGGPLQRFLV